uniref:Uncharacterized protein n=1 Tax=Trichinella nativa TaxID=6335 RepID=A0A0V1KHC7_9BILA
MIWIVVRNSEKCEIGKIPKLGPGFGVKRENVEMQTV